MILTSSESTNLKGAKSKTMAKQDKGSKTSAETGAATATAETAGTQPADVTVPVEGGAQAAADGKEKKPAKPAIPEHLKKGNRVCASCGTTEAEFLAKNPRYSLCQGVDVLCYRKGDRVIYGATLEEVNAKYPDKVGKTDEKTNKPLIEEVSGTGIKPGILVRGAISYKRKAVDTAAAGAPASGEATGSASTTSVG
jgi:hypothetical protein